MPTKVKLNLGRDRWLFQFAGRRKSPASKGDMDSSTPAVTMTSFQAAMEVRGDKQYSAALSLSQNFKRNGLIHPAYSGSIVQHCFRLLCLQKTVRYFSHFCFARPKKWLQEESLHPPRRFGLHQLLPICQEPSSVSKATNFSSMATHSRSDTQF